MQLLRGIIHAEARVWYADMRLDAFVDRLNAALLLAVNKDTTDARYTAIFSKRPHELKRPVLGGQLATMLKWPEILSGAAYQGFPDVVALLPELQARLAVATDAQNARNTALENIKNFRTVGERKAFTDAFNALRKASLGKLLEMPHKLTAEALPSDFADWFFPPRRRGSEDATAKELGERIDALETELAALKQQHQAALDKENAEAARKQSREEKRAALDAARKDAAERAKRVKELEAELERG
ncbi:cell envelope integrity protein TolA [Polyangium sp. 15x6]|uniref:cell envelope integrity protein TolA n=1 Tax=Polyangium sp. 15x6 TaxID=3042687 RepID=UPI00249B7D73|nr:cell envelope integrity protein TolA [Polyangium sp. 15x6]MDI3286354.1 cell envelope integrity protein TolA [Polyangium sp. 15x6]